MRLSDRMENAQFIFETVGYLQFSTFYLEQDPLRAELTQKVARATAGVFMLLSISDFFMHPLPAIVRLIVNGTIIALTSSLALSLLLKAAQKIFSQDSEESELVEVLEESDLFQDLSENELQQESEGTESEKNELIEEGASSPQSEGTFSNLSATPTPVKLDSNAEFSADYLTPSPPPVSWDRKEWKKNLKGARRNLLPEFEKIAKSAESK